MGNQTSPNGETNSSTSACQVLVLHQGAIGDFILTLSVIQAVRAALARDDAHVTAIASSPAAQLAAGRSAIDLWISPERVELHRLFGQDEPLSDFLSALLNRANFILNFLGNESAPMHRRLCHAATGHVISIDSGPTKETLAAGRHITSQWREAVVQAGMDVGPAGPPVIRLHATAEESTDQHGWHPPRRIVIHPGSGGRAKCWPIHRFTELADSLDRAVDDVEIRWMLGAVEQERDELCVTTVQQRVREHGESLVIEDDLIQAAHIIAAAEVYIGNDSGMTHLAAALGLSVVAIFGPTDPRVWRPLGTNVRTVAPSRSGEIVSLDQVRATVTKMLG